MSISDFHDIMNDTIVHHPFSSRNAYGKPVYGTSAEIENCRVVYKEFKFRKPDGSEILAKGIVWLGSYLRISVDDKIVLPDGTDHPVLYSESFPDDIGMHHTKVVLG